MNKVEIRKDILSKREQLNGDIWNKNSLIIQKNVLKSKLYKQADCIMIYANFRNEVGTIMIIEDALINNKRVFLPKVLEDFDDNRMEFYEIFSTCELIGGFKGILEPTGNRERIFNCDEFAGKNVLMFLPGVAFSDKGYRIGYGKGYYDRYLCDKPFVVKAGLCFDIQKVQEFEILDTDIKLDIIISESIDVSDIDNINFYEKEV